MKMLPNRRWMFFGALALLPSCSALDSISTTAVALSDSIEGVKDTIEVAAQTTPEGFPAWVGALLAAVAGIYAKFAAKGEAQKMSDKRDLARAHRNEPVAKEAANGNAQ